MAQNMYTEGEHAYWFNNTDEDVFSGEPLLFGERVAVALVDIPKDASGTVSLVHVYSLPKVPGEEITQGKRVFLTPEYRITSDKTVELPFAGFAFLHSASGEPEVKVRLGY